MASTSPGTSRLSVRVSPNAPRDEIAGFAEGVLRVRVAAPPEKGKANRELVDLLSRELDIPRSLVRLVSGESARHKVVCVPTSLRPLLVALAERGGRG